ncbi:hypothetical protein [Paenibacillus sp. FSL H8-0537]|uniref:hypothetical protein n=1 Tax=Paenibacillus sp. FSL H8-0537 TaxID=2921399 RepID=UPI003100DA3D
MHSGICFSVPTPKMAPVRFNQVKGTNPAPDADFGAIFMYAQKSKKARETTYNAASQAFSLYDL